MDKGDGVAVDLFNDQPTAVVYGESPICRRNVGEAFGNGPGRSIHSYVADLEKHLLR